MVCNALRSCTALELLFVHDVMMTTKGALSVASLVRDVRSLGSLKVGSNYIGVSGLRALCKEVSAANTLEELYLYDVNHTGDESSEGVQIFIEVCAMPPRSLHQGETASPCDDCCCLCRIRCSNRRRLCVGLI